MNPTPTGATFVSIVKQIATTVLVAEVTLTAIAVAIFFFGIFRFVWSVSTKGKQDGYKMIVWGLVTIFVIFSLQAILWTMCRSLLSSQTGGFCSSGGSVGPGSSLEGGPGNGPAGSATGGQLP
jgi:hypothetical protein